MTTPPGGSRLAEDLPEDLFGPTLAPQWSHDGKGAALLEGGRAPQAKSRQAEDRPWRGQDDKGGDSWTGGGGGLQGLRAPIDAAVRPRWREDERQIGPRRPDARWGVAEHDGVRRAENGPQRPLADIPALAGSPVERWGGDAGRGRGRGPPGPTPPRWGAPGPERHQHPDRWGGPIAPETRPREARDKWEKWGGFEGGPKEPHMPHDDKWRPPHVGFGHSPGAGPRDAPSFGPPGGHAFMEPRGDPVPAGRGRGFAIGRGRSIPGPAHAPGAEHRWGAHHPHPPAVSDDSYAIGKQPSKHDPSQSLGSKAKYPSSKMLAVFSQLEAKHALALPAGVNRDEPSLFAVSGQPTVMEVLHGNHNKLPEGDRLSAPDTPAQQAQAPSADSELPPAQKPANSASAETHLRPQSAHQQQSSAASPTPSTSIAQGAADSQQPTASPFATAAGSSASVAPEPSISSEHVQDAWVYRDPNWQVQGPFSKADILDWFEGGFFPATLPIRHASNPQADFKPLAAQIKVWAAAAPPGFARQKLQSSMPASTQPATPAQQPPVEQQPLRSAASAHQQQQQQQPQSQADINRTYTLTTAGSNSTSYMGPNSASSARLDELETGVNKSSVPEPARPAAEPVGMDLIHMLTRGHSGASTSQSALPTPGQDPLAQFTGLQQGLSAAAPWGHQAQTGSAASGPFDHSNPILGPVGSGLAPHDPFASRPFSQPMRQDPPQQHALPAFLTSATNHVVDRSHSGLQDRGMFSQPFASHPQASLDHLNLGAAGLGMQPQQQQQQRQQTSLWGGQQHAQSTAQLFGGLKRPEQQQSQQPQQGALSDFQRLLQQALPQQQHQPPPSPLQVSHPTSKAPESPGAPPHPPAVLQPVQQESEPVAAPPKRKAAAPKKAAPGPNPQPAAAPTPAWAMPEQAPPSLAGVQLEQQQQRQQEQQQLPDWGLPSEAPASPKKAETKAPWGASKPPVPAGGNLHDILREEEAKAAAARAAQPASTDVKTAAPGANRASGWARVAASPTASRGHVQTLKEIQEEEERARRSEARQQQTQQQQQPDQAQGFFSLRDSFVGEAQALVAPKMAPWAAAAGRHQEESASDLEGGNSGYHQEHFTQPPPPPPRKPAPAKEEKKRTAQEVKREQMEEQRRAAAAARQEIKEDKKPKQAAAGPAPSMALRTAASLQRALSNDDDGMFWDYGPAAGQRGNGSVPAPAAAKPAGQANGRPPASQQWQSPQTSPGPPPNKPMPQDMPATPETIKMSSEFKTWASQKIRSLSKGRIDDPSVLLDVLMDTPSNGEVVEGCLVNIERNGDVSAFATEFIRRKAAELAGHKGKAKAAPAAVPPGSSSAAAPIPAAAASDPSKFQKVPKVNKGKKGKASKGQKVGNQLLGFSTKSDFSVLERGDDYA